MHKTKKPLDTEENAGIAVVISGIDSLRVTLCSYFAPASYMIVLLIQWNGTHHQSIWYSYVSITLGNKSPIENFIFQKSTFNHLAIYLTAIYSLWWFLLARPIHTGMPTHTKVWIRTILKQNWHKHYSPSWCLSSELVSGHQSMEMTHTYVLINGLLIKILTPFHLLAVNRWVHSPVHITNV